MTADLPDDLRSLDEKLTGVFKDFAPPADLDARITRNLTRRSRLRFSINPMVIKSAAAVVAIGLLGAFGYVADRQMNGGQSALSTAASLHDLGRQLRVLSNESATGQSTGEYYMGGTLLVGGTTVAGYVQKEAGTEAKLKSEFANAPELPLGINGSTETPAPGIAPASSVSPDFSLTTSSEGAGGGGGGDGDFFGEAEAGWRIRLDHRFQPGKFGRAVTPPAEVLKELDLKPTRGAVVDREVGGDRAPANRPTPVLVAGGEVAIPKPADGPSAQTDPAPLFTGQKVIRSGTVEFEVDSFDTALMTITKLIIEDGGFVASTDSAKLPNGKTRGAITLRIQPERLDTFVLKLRGLGDLKSQKISAQDVSKMYSDIDSGLRAARAMEGRLLEMIQKGQGAIKDLLAAEKELGTWREKIEKLEGEKRYYDNLIGLSTLTVALQERDIKASAASVETESVNAGVETEDVEKSRAELIKAIDEAKGRIITSDLKKLDAGQFAATIVAEVAPEQSGPLVDRLKQLGKVARLDVDRRQTTVDGTGTPVPGAHIEKKPTRLTVSLYNLANVAPRLTTSATIAADDVQARYREVMASVEKAGGRVVNSSLQRPKQDEVAATLQIEVPAAQAAAMQTSLATVGEVMNLQLTDNPDTANVTTAKQGFSLRIISAQSVPARETATLQLAAKDVAGAHKALLEIAQKAGARVLQSNVVEGDRDRISGVLQLELPRANQPEWDKALADSGEVLTRAVQRSNDTQNTLDSKLRLNLTLFPADRLPPRQTTSATLNVEGAEGVQASFIALAEQLGGRVIDQNVSRDPHGRNSARVVFDVPRDKAPQIIKDLRTTGEIWSMNTTSNPQAPDGALSRSRFDLSLSEGSALIGKDAGVWSSIRDGLSTSLRGLAWSLQLIIIGVCLVAPWLLVLWGAWKLIKRSKRKPVVA